jgi:hypothetical protein
MRKLKAVCSAFKEGWKSQGAKRKALHEDKMLRESLSEKQIDKMLQDSFPASDPPSTY